MKFCRILRVSLNSLVIHIIVTSIALLITEWLTEGKIKKLVLALCDVNSKEPLECWEFRILAEETPTGEIKQQGTKPLKDIQQEIRNVLRQITACVTFLPLLDCVCMYLITYPVSHELFNFILPLHP